jgi:hypothetical protein
MDRRAKGLTLDVDFRAGFDPSDPLPGVFCLEMHGAPGLLLHYIAILSEQTAS